MIAQRRAVRSLRNLSSRLRGVVFISQSPLRRSLDFQRVGLGTMRS
jgi:hypothetical protein